MGASGYKLEGAYFVNDSSGDQYYAIWGSDSELEALRGMSMKYGCMLAEAIDRGLTTRSWSYSKRPSVVTTIRNLVSGHWVSEPNDDDPDYGYWVDATDEQRAEASRLLASLKP